MGTSLSTLWSAGPSAALTEEEYERTQTGGLLITFTKEVM